MNLNRYDHRLCGLLGLSEYWTEENKGLRALKVKMATMSHNDLGDQEDELLDRLSELYIKATDSGKGCLVCATTDYYEARNILIEEDSEEAKDLLISNLMGGN